MEGEEVLGEGQCSGEEFGKISIWKIISEFKKKPPGNIGKDIRRVLIQYYSRNWNKEGMEVLWFRMYNYCLNYDKNK